MRKSWQHLLANERVVRREILTTASYVEDVVFTKVSELRLTLLLVHVNTIKIVGLHISIKYTCI
jgi:hypothetical protein